MGVEREYQSIFLIGESSVESPGAETKAIITGEESNWGCIGGAGTGVVGEGPDLKGAVARALPIREGTDCSTRDGGDTVLAAPLRREQNDAMRVPRLRNR